MEDLPAASSSTSMLGSTRTVTPEDSTGGPTKHSWDHQRNHHSPSADEREELLNSEKEPLLLYQFPPTPSEEDKPTHFCFRKSRCCGFASLRHWHCAALWTFLVLAVLLPLLYCLLIPAIVEHAIAQAPPITIDLIDIQRIHSNETIAMWLLGYLDAAQMPLVSLFSARFAPSLYNFTLNTYVQSAYPSEVDLSNSGMYYRATDKHSRTNVDDHLDVINLGFIDLGQLGRHDDKPLYMDTFALFHDGEMANLKTVILLASNYLKSVFGSMGGLKATHAQETIAAETIATETFATETFATKMPPRRYRYGRRYTSGSLTVIVLELMVALRCI